MPSEKLPENALEEANFKLKEIGSVLDNNVGILLKIQKGDFGAIDLKVRRVLDEMINKFAHVVDSIKSRI